MFNAHGIVLARQIIIIIIIIIIVIIIIIDSKLWRVERIEGNAVKSRTNYLHCILWLKEMASCIHIRAEHDIRVFRKLLETRLF